MSIFGKLTGQKMQKVFSKASKTWRNG